MRGGPHLALGRDPDGMQEFWTLPIRTWYQSRPGPRCPVQEGFGSPSLTHYGLWVELVGG